MYHSLGKLASWCWLKTGPPCSKVQIMNEQIGRIAHFVNVACVNNFPNSLAGAGACNPINVWVGGEGGGFKWESLPLVPPGTLLPLCSMYTCQNSHEASPASRSSFWSLKNFFPRPHLACMNRILSEKGHHCHANATACLLPPLALVTRWPCHAVALSRGGLFTQRHFHAVALSHGGLFTWWPCHTVAFSWGGLVTRWPFHAVALSRRGFVTQWPYQGVA